MKRVFYLKSHKNKVNKNAITFNDINKMRKVAVALKEDYPYFPLLLELCIMGLGRKSIAAIRLQDLKDNYLIWRSRHNVYEKIFFNDSQLDILHDYLKWRRRRKLKHDYLLVARRNSNDPKIKRNYMPIKHERVRHDIKIIGREADIHEKMEISYIREAVDNYLSGHNIHKRYLKKRFNINNGQK